jgi:hypothetical protein
MAGPLGELRRLLASDVGELRIPVAEDQPAGVVRRLPVAG